MYGHTPEYEWFIRTSQSSVVHRSGSRLTYWPARFPTGGRVRQSKPWWRSRASAAEAEFLSMPSEAERVRALYSCCPCITMNNQTNLSVGSRCLNCFGRARVATPSRIAAKCHTDTEQPAFKCASCFTNRTTNTGQRGKLFYEITSKMKESLAAGFGSVPHKSRR